MLRLSIIVNMYNTAKYMQKCVDSLLCQDIPAEEYEIIFVDDCSPDESLEMANEYEVKSKSEEGRTKWPAIKVCHHEVNKGLAAGRNTGVDAAEGTYLCFVDPDDYIEKNSLKALLDQMDAENLDMLRFNYQKVDEEYHNVADDVEEASFDYSSQIISGKEFLVKRLGIRCYVWAYVYRTSLIKDNSIRFIEGIYFDDTPWLPRVLQKAERVNCTNVRRQYYLQRGGSLVHTRNADAIRRKIKGQLDLINVLRTQRASVGESLWIWYDRMIAHLAVSMLTSVSTISTGESINLYKRLKSMSLFPLSKVGSLPKIRMKISLLNTIPCTFILILNIKNN